MAEGSTPVEIFCCYTHEDEMWRQKLETHLSLLRRQGLVSFWHDRQILPGTDWAKAIDMHLETASVILLLISANFFASDYCYGIEMKRALEREAAKEAHVIPILVHPADWKDAPFAHLQALPTNAKPIASWRSTDRALADVVAGIRRVIEDMTRLVASAPLTALPAIWNIPYWRNPFFTGRDELLEQLHTHLLTTRAMAISQPQAISGLGGVGKTQLAIEYAYRSRQEYQVILWARAETTEDLNASYAEIARLLRLPQKDAQEQEVIVQAVKNWLRGTNGWLLILDNANDLNIVQTFLPPVYPGHLLLTTRVQSMGKLARRLEVKTLDREGGVTLLLRRAGLIEPEAALNAASALDQSVALALTEELGGLPLALDQAGAYIEETQCTLTDYHQQYQTKRAELLARRGRWVDDHPEPVATTWSLSFAQVEAANPLAAEVLRICAFLAPDAIPEELPSQALLPERQSQWQLHETMSQLYATTAEYYEGMAKLVRDLGIDDGISEKLPSQLPEQATTWEFNEAIAALRAYSLVQRQDGLLQVHRLIQAVVRDTMTEQEQIAWITRMVRAVKALLSSGTAENWKQSGRYLPHALACAEWIREKQLPLPDGAEVCSGAGSYFLQRAQYSEAESLFQQALHFWKLSRGPEHPRVAATLNGLASVYLEQGKYEQAEPLYQRALRIWELSQRPEHLDMAATLNNLGELYLQQGKYEQAELLFLRTLHIREQSLGPEHVRTAYSLNGLANVYVEQGKYAQAEPLYQRALRIREQHLGPEDLDTAETMHDLARFREMQGNSEEARAWYVRTLAARLQALGAHHPKTMETRKRLIALLHAMGQHEEVAQFEETQFEP